MTPYRSISEEAEIEVVHCRAVVAACREFIYVLDGGADRPKIRNISDMREFLRKEQDYFAKRLLGYESSLRREST